MWEIHKIEKSGEALKIVLINEGHYLTMYMTGKMPFFEVIEILNNFDRKKLSWTLK